MADGFNCIKGDAVGSTKKKITDVIDIVMRLIMDADVTEGKDACRIKQKATRVGDTQKMDADVTRYGR